MAAHIESLNIEHFRGIHNLTIKNLNHINIIAGDNNSGKTSVLEAVRLLQSPVDFNNIISMSRTRELDPFFGASSLYESFINLFPKNKDTMEIAINANCKGEHVFFSLSGKQAKVMMESEDIAKRWSSINKGTIANNIGSDIVEVDAFSGLLDCRVGEYHYNENIYVDSYTSFSGREVKQDKYLNMMYSAPTDYTSRPSFGRILRNDILKEHCLNILKLFDVEIYDLVILKNETNNRFIEYLKHKTLGTMPLSTYGDGIKKVLSLANGIAHAVDGVLLIDEVETAIHSKHYKNIFRFLAQACKQFNVQVFATTHNIEAIDGLLASQDYDKQDENDDISVLTFKKDADGQKTNSRVLSGRKVYTNREQFDFEVRL